MIIVWGSKGFSKEEESPVYDKCPKCNNESRYKLVTVGRKFTLFWIPLFTMSKKRYLACPICSAGVELQDKEYQQLKTDLESMKQALAGNNTDTKQVS